MSAIDQYKHREIGCIECPSTFDIVYNNPTRKVAIYELLQDVPPYESDFDGKTGDLIVGGGSGEVPAFRISIPQALFFFTKDDWDDFDSYSDIFKAFWTPTASYKLCEGYSKIGWTTDTSIEYWLAQNISLLLINNIDHYSAYKTSNLSESVLSLLDP